MTSKIHQMKSQSNPIPRMISKNLPKHLTCLKNLPRHLKNRIKTRSLRLKQIVIKAVRRLQLRLQVQVQVQVQLLKSLLIQSKKIVRITKQTIRRKQQKTQNKIKTTVNRPLKALIQNRINRRSQKKNWTKRS